MKTTATILFFLLAISLLILYIQWREGKELGNKAAESARIAERNHSLQEIRVRDRHIQAVLEDRDSVIRVGTLREATLSSQIKALKSRLIPASAINALAPVECYTEVLKRDTIILKQDSLVLTLEEEKAEILRMDSIAFDSLQANVMQFQELFESEAKETVKLESKLEKEKRKRFSIGPAVGYGVSKDGLSPNLSISIQYRLFKF